MISSFAQGDIRMGCAQIKAYSQKEWAFVF
jgi:hypothetical protein